MPYKFFSLHGFLDAKYYGTIVVCFRFREAGYKEGFGDGQLAGQADGFRLGVESGTKVGMEVRSISHLKHVE